MRSTGVTNARPTGVTSEPPAPQKPEPSRPARWPLFLVVAVLLAALLIALWVNMFDAPQTQRGVTDAVVQALRNEGMDEADEVAAAGFTWNDETEFWECRGRGFSISYRPATRRINVRIFYLAGHTCYTGTLTRTITGQWVAPLQERDQIRY